MLALATSAAGVVTAEESTRMARHLPVLQNQDPEDLAAEQRSPGNWVVVGALLAFTIWLPLLLVAQYVSAKWVLSLANQGDPDLARVALAQLTPILLSLALANASAGALVGRFGGQARVLHAALAGALMASGVAGFTLLMGVFASLAGALPAVVVLLLTSTACAALGGWLGVKRRPNALAKSPKRAK